MKEMRRYKERKEMDPTYNQNLDISQLNNSKGKSTKTNKFTRKNIE